MKKVLRCRRRGTEVEMNCMTKKVRQWHNSTAEVFSMNPTSRWHQRHQQLTLEMNHYEDVWDLIRYLRFCITKLTSRYFPLRTPFPMKKVLRCHRTGAEVKMNCMTKKVRQLEMNHYEDVWPSTQYRRFSITKLTSRYFPLTIPFQELTLQMNNYLDFIVVEDSEATTTGGLIFTYPIYLQCNTTTVKSIFYVWIYL